MKNKSNTQGKSFRWGIALFSLFVIASLVAGCTAAPTPTAAPQATEAPAETTAPTALKVKVGVSPVPHAEIVNFVKDNLAAEAGLEIEVVEFTDYILPNEALSDGSIDVNFFQHLPYLNDYNQQRGTDLLPVATIHIEPLGIYSRTLKSLDELEDGAVVGIPNDATNGGRALQLLAANGLLVLEPDAGFTATVDQIVENPKNLKISELEAAQLVRALEDTAISVINGNYALEGGLKPSEDALALESGEDNPYANILAVKAGRGNEPAIQLFVRLITSDAVKDFIDQKYGGSVIPAFSVIENVPQ